MTENYRAGGRRTRSERCTTGELSRRRRPPAPEQIPAPTDCRSHPEEQLRALLAAIPAMLVEPDREGAVAILNNSRRALRQQRVRAFIFSAVLAVAAAGTGLLCGLAWSWLG